MQPLKLGKDNTCDITSQIQDHIINTDLLPSSTNIVNNTIAFIWFDIDII